MGTSAVVGSVSSEPMCRACLSRTTTFQLIVHLRHPVESCGVAASRLGMPSGSPSLLEMTLAMLMYSCAYRMIVDASLLSLQGHFPTAR